MFMMTFETMSWWISYWYHFSTDEWDLTDSRCDCIVRDQCLDRYCNYYGTESYWESIVRPWHLVQLYSSYTQLLLLFTMYTTTVTDTVITSSQYSSNIDFDSLTDLNNNVNRQLTLGLGKLMEETASIFCVDLRYRLRSRLRVPLQGSREMTGIPSVLFTVPLLSKWDYYYYYSIHSGTAWFSAKKLRSWSLVCTGPT